LVFCQTNFTKTLGPFLCFLDIFFLFFNTLRVSERELAIAERLITRWARFNSLGHVVVDLGFLDPSVRFVENIAILFIRTAEPASLNFVNVRSRRVSPNRIRRTLQELEVKFQSAIRIICGQRDTREVDLGTKAHKNKEKLRWRKVELSESLFCQLQYRANTEFLTSSFNVLGPLTGFYTGKVHLLSGNIVDRYFSLVAHFQADKGNAAHRWIESFGMLINLAMENVPNERTKLLGFAASMRPVLESVNLPHSEKWEVFCLLSYARPVRRNWPR
jgi:hypothetical protein